MLVVPLLACCTWIADFPEESPAAGDADEDLDATPDADGDADIDADSDTDTDADTDADADVDADVDGDEDAEVERLLSCVEVAMCALDCRYDLDCLNACVLQICERDAELFTEIMACVAACPACLEGVDTPCWNCVIERCPEASQRCLASGSCD